MPYDDEGMDVYEEAILGVVRDCGYICEMTGQTSVVFIAKKGEQLHFDVHSHRCVFYGRFKELRIDLAELLQGLGA